MIHLTAPKKDRAINHTREKALPFLAAKRYQPLKETR